MHWVRWDGQKFVSEWYRKDSDPSEEKAAFDHAKKVYYEAYEDAAWKRICREFKEMGITHVTVFREQDIVNLIFHQRAA